MVKSSTTFTRCAKAMILGFTTFGIVKLSTPVEPLTNAEATANGTENLPASTFLGEGSSSSTARE